MAAPGLGIIRAASRLVPRERREAWTREWEAETTYAWQALQRRGRASTLAGLRLRVRVLTCWIDALWERKETMTMTGLMNDLRFAARSLRRNPAFTMVAILTLALGIGANTAVFTLVDGVLIRPLPFHRPEQLLSLEHLGRDGQDELPMSLGLYLVYRDQAPSLASIGLYGASVVNLVTDGEPQRIPAQVVTPSFFKVLGVEAEVGRTFLEEEGVPDAERVAILSDGLWRSTFGADPSVVGRTVDMNGEMIRVVGVMPPDFGFPDRRARIWMPMRIDPNNVAYAAFGSGGVARLADGRTVDNARTELQGLVDRLADFAPGDEAAFLSQVGLKAYVRPLKEAVVGNVGSTLWILLGTVGFVLLIACANVANLLLVRAEGRQRELALRVAVGAGRMEVIRSFMGESLVLGLGGGALGVGVAWVAVRLTSRFIPTDLPRMAEVGMDGRVLAFTAVVSLGCAVFFGLFPMVRYGTHDLTDRLKDGGARGGTGGRRQHRLRNALVVVQIAMALILLVGSGLMFRSFLALRAVDPGFDADHVLTARISLPDAEVPGAEQKGAFFRQLRERAEALPGVSAAGFVTRVPLGGGVSFGSIEVEDQPRTEGDLPVFAYQLNAGPGYFEAMGIPVLEGRGFLDDDGPKGTRGVVVNQAFARHWWPDGSALGRRVRSGFPDEEWWDIVGVVGDVHRQGLAAPAGESVYFPPVFGAASNPVPARTMDLVVKTTAEPLLLVSAIRQQLRELNPRVPLSNPQTMDAVLTAATARTSFTMAMLGAASGIAVLLGLVGIYGVISYLVSQRTREIGVRMALGASAPSVRRMVVKQGLAMAGVGVVVGLAAAGALSRLMSSLLFDVSAGDPATYATVSAALVVVAVGASWIPARRAASVDPSRALRSE